MYMPCARRYASSAARVRSKVTNAYPNGIPVTKLYMTLTEEMAPYSENTLFSFSAGLSQLTSKMVLLNIWYLHWCLDQDALQTMSLEGLWLYLSAAYLFLLIKRLMSSVVTLLP
jgi:hypothetical protein